MKSLVVFFAVASVACGSLLPIAQPPHSPAVVLDARGRPLDTAEVINARVLHLQAKALEGHHGHVAPVAVVAPIAHSIAVAPAVIAAPAAVSHQSRVDVISGHGVGAPLLAYGGLGYGGHGHYLGKRSLGHYAYAAPIVKVAVAPVAVSHQSRVDVHSSPAVVSHAVVAPYAHTAVLPIAHHGALAHINHAAVAPIVHSAPLVHAW